MEPVPDGAAILGPRARSHRRTREDVKRVALDQLDEAGPVGVSVNAIAKRIGVTGPALYRYFASRDVLLDELTADAHVDLADAMEDVLRQNRRKAPATRFKAVATEFRAWAHRRPSRYSLVSGNDLPAARPLEPVAAARPLKLFLDVLAECVPSERAGRRTALDRELAVWWAERGGTEVSPAVLRRGVLTWTRLHGVIGVELAGTGPRGDRLFRAEVENLLTESP